ncbi:MAG: acyl-ACP--UDP-N-acetylglucosamine O-acyltransferase [Proteobacteria bacterium]|nr:acyl-ACP--UDP-N-acetylglucosamine O-acyltransferase [Pseudomonadota bacterium]
MANQIHPTAVVDPGAALGENITVGPYVIIEGDTVIGDGTRIDAFAQIKRYTTMGANNVIHSNALIGGEPQDIKFKDSETRVVMGDGNIIREFVTVHRGTLEGRGETRIGSHCMIMAYAHVAHDCILHDHAILVNCVMLAGHVDIGTHAVVSGMTGVHQFTRIGDYAFIGGMSGVSLDVPPYTHATGVRGALRGLNVIGLRRSGMDRAAVKALKQAYTTIFRSGMGRKEALAEAEEVLGHVPEVMKMVEFIRSSERGVHSDIGMRNGDKDS